MESVGKSFDVDGKFREIEGIFGVFKEDRPWREYDYDGEAIKIVSGLTDILKEINQKSPNKPNNRLVDRVCKFIMRSVKKEMLYGTYLGKKGVAKFCSHS